MELLSVGELASSVMKGEQPRNLLAVQVLGSKPLNGNTEQQRLKLWDGRSEFTQVVLNISAREDLTLPSPFSVVRLENIRTKKAGDKWCLVIDDYSLVRAGELIGEKIVSGSPPNSQMTQSMAFGDVTPPVVPGPSNGIHPGSRLSSVMDHRSSVISHRSSDHRSWIMDHGCPNNGCDQKMPLVTLKCHKKICPYRGISCPSCDEKLQYSGLIEHFHNSHDNDIVTMNVSEAYMSEGYMEVELNLLKRFVGHFLYLDHYFFVKGQINNKLGNIYVQMLGTGLDCNKFYVKLEIYKKKETTAVSFCDHPFPIDMEEEDQKTAGLLVAYNCLQNMCTESDGRLRFNIKLTIEVRN